jgi:hypothetical protein
MASNTNAIAYYVLDNDKAACQQGETFRQLLTTLKTNDDKVAFAIYYLAVCFSHVFNVHLLIRKRFFQSDEPFSDAIITILEGQDFTKLREFLDNVCTIVGTVQLGHIELKTGFANLLVFLTSLNTTRFRQYIQTCSFCVETLDRKIADLYNANSNTSDWFARGYIDDHLPMIMERTENRKRLPISTDETRMSYTTALDALLFLLRWSDMFKNVLASNISKMSPVASSVYNILLSYKQMQGYKSFCSDLYPTKMNALNEMFENNAVAHHTHDEMALLDMLKLFIHPTRLFHSSVYTRKQDKLIENKNFLDLLPRGADAVFICHTEQDLNDFQHPCITLIVPYNMTIERHDKAGQIVETDVFRIACFGIRLQLSGRKYRTVFGFFSHKKTNKKLVIYVYDPQRCHLDIHECKNDDNSQCPMNMLKDEHFKNMIPGMVGISFYLYLRVPLKRP